MKKTGKYIAGMLLAMGMSLAGAVSGFAAPDGEAVPERFFCDEYRIGLR